MAGLRIAYGDNTAAALMRDDWSRRRAALDRPLRAAPACEKPLEIREAASVAALFDIVKKMPSAAIAIFPARGERRLQSIKGMLASTPTYIGRVAFRKSAISRCCVGHSRCDARSPNRTDLLCSKRAQYRTPPAVIVDERDASRAGALRLRADHPDSDRLALPTLLSGSNARPVARPERLICSSIATRRFCMRLNRSAT